MYFYLSAKFVNNSTNYSAAPSGSILNPVTWTVDVSGSEVGAVTVAAGPTFKEHKASV